MNGERAVKVSDIIPKIPPNATDQDGIRSNVPFAIIDMRLTLETNLCEHGIPQRAHPNSPYSVCTMCFMREGKVV